MRRYMRRYTCHGSHINLPKSLGNRANDTVYLKTNGRRMYSGSWHWMSIDKSSRWKAWKRLLSCKLKKSAWRKPLSTVSDIVEDGPRRCTLSKWWRIKTRQEQARRRFESYGSQAWRQSEAGYWRCLPHWKAAGSLEDRAARKVRKAREEGKKTRALSRVQQKTAWRWLGFLCFIFILAPKEISFQVRVAVTNGHFVNK